MLTLLPYVNHFKFTLSYLSFSFPYDHFDPWLIQHLGICFCFFFFSFCLSFLFYQVGIKGFILRGGYDICKGFESLLSARVEFQVRRRQSLLLRHWDHYWGFLIKESNTKSFSEKGLKNCIHSVLTKKKEYSKYKFRTYFSKLNV